MLRIRLTRIGKKKQPSYRIIVADKRSPRDGAFLKIIGHYNPRTEPATLVIREEEAIHWLKQGALPSETAAKLLTRAGVMEAAGKAPVRYVGKEVPPGKRPKKGAPEAVAPAAAPAAVAAAPEVAPAAEADAATAEAEGAEETPQETPSVEAEGDAQEPESTE